MKSIKINSSVGDDGILKLNLPLDFRNTDLEVMVIVQPVEKPKPWIESFFEATYGAFKDEPIERPEQNQPETRLGLE